MGVAPLGPFLKGLRPDPGKRLICLTTHTHVDHIGAVHEFDERLVHQIEAPRLASPAPYALRPNGVSEAFRDLFRTFGHEELWPLLINALPHADDDIDGYVLRGVPATGLINNGDVIDLGARQRLSPRCYQRLARRIRMSVAGPGVVLRTDSRLTTFEKIPMTLTDANPNTKDRVLIGVALMLGFCLTAPLLDVAAKLASATVPVGQITAARFVVQCFLMAPFILIMRLSLRIPSGQRMALVARALLLLFATFCFIAAIRVMPLADALAIVFVAPFIVLLVGKFYLSEDVGPRRVGAALVGFVGVLFVIQPSFAAFGLVAFIPLGTAVAFAFYILLTRGLSRRMHPVALQFHTGLIAAMFCIPVLFIASGSGSDLFDPVWPSNIAWIWLLSAGFFATLSHIMMTYALSFAPSATLAPLQYFELPVATLFAYLVFNEFPNALSLVGIAVIIGAGLYMIHRERVAAKQLVTARAAPPV